MASAGDILNDLDSFLDRLSEGEEEEELYLGDACATCRINSSPLMAAIVSNHRGCLKEILRMGSLAGAGGTLLSVRSENGATLAHVAARKGDTEALELVLRADSSLCREGDIRGATPLHVCAYHGREEGLALLLDAGAETNQTDFDGATAIHFAAASGHLDSLKLLLEQGKGDVNAQTNSGETPGERRKRAERESERERERERSERIG